MKHWHTLLVYEKVVLGTKFQECDNVMSRNKYVHFSHSHRVVERAG